MMDIFVVLVEWIDLGLGGLGIFGGLFLYRRRHLVREALWWWSAQNRLRWLKIYLDTMPTETNRREAIDDLSRTLCLMGHPLNKAETEFAANYQSGKKWHIIRHKSRQGVEGGVGTRGEKPTNQKPGAH